MVRQRRLIFKKTDGIWWRLGNRGCKRFEARG
jgi:hypothetical protein